MADLKISDLPTDIVALADGDKFPVADASALTANTFATALEIREYVNSTTAFIRVPSSGVALANTTSPQAIFNSPNKLTLTPGIYRYTGVLSISGMSATSNNCSFQINVAAGGPGLFGSLFHAIGIDGSGAATGQTGTWSASTGTPSNMVSASTSTTLFAKVDGWFRVPTGQGGTIQVGVALANAVATAVVNEPTFFMITRVCDESVTNIGSWTT